MNRKTKGNNPTAERGRKTQHTLETEPSDFTQMDYQRTIHDLRVHQIELDHQNEELRETQQKLEESRSLYRVLYNHAPVGYFTFDGTGRILTANITGAMQLGADRVALHNKPFPSFLSQEDADLFYLHLKKVLSSDGKQTCTLKILQENGPSFFAQVDSVPSFSAASKEPFCQTTITDINDRKELEESLKLSETRYRRLFEVTREGILILDAETGRISDANPYLLEMLGYAPEELLGKRLWEIGCFKDTQASISEYKKLRQKGYVRYDNLPLQTKNGRVIAVEVISSIYLVNRSKLIICTIRDVSIQKLTQATSRPASPAGTNRRLSERRAVPPLPNGHGEQKNDQHQGTEESLRKALEEIKELKDRLVVENIFFRREIIREQRFNHVIGQSDGLKYVLYRAEQVAPTDTTVLVLGETGTGKELIAGAIHNLSPRNKLPLITVNCAALPATLLESELFGREKGAFTGAESRQIGRFEIADGSTICLDEIGELPLEMQAKLLRVIQHGEFQRLGSAKTIKVDVRIVATTNRNLEEEIIAGKFRKDLYYRLNVFPITVPPLRQRKEDIALMVEAFVERYARKLGKKITSIPKETMQALQDYPWPGNVRELESIIERSVILCPGPGFQLADNLTPASPSIPATGGTLKEMERSLILATLAETEWRIEGKNGAAVILDLHPSTLRARMHKLEIIRPDKKTSF
ncbi:MAG: sigma 54-interacting transcriptional regulator [Proteobacteria bacterium]|nr:sigma 54-interacting transcriptional regulator [Pseudomonadota bacterium]MBU1687073.1 sigma 54-interacting transcriptional regulator [Pseudomonadota bacterium]